MIFINDFSTDSLGFMFNTGSIMTCIQNGAEASFTDALRGWKPTLSAFHITLHQPLCRITVTRQPLGYYVVM